MTEQLTVDRLLYARQKAHEYQIDIYSIYLKKEMKEDEHIDL
jgi:hypothetical protein